MAKHNQSKKESLDHARLVVLKALGILFSMRYYQDNTISGDMGTIVQTIAELIDQGRIISKDGHSMHTSNGKIRDVLKQLYKEGKYDIPALSEEQPRKKIKTTGGLAAQQVIQKSKRSSKTHENLRINSMKQVSGTLTRATDKNGREYFFLSVTEEQYSRYDGMLVYGEKEFLAQNVGKIVGVTFESREGKIQPAGRIDVVFEGSELDIYTNKIYYDYGLDKGLDSSIKKQIEEECAAVRTEVTQQDIDDLNSRLKPENQVRDLRALPTITMDPDDCVDMDDAVYTEAPNGNKQTQYISIALVAHYVPKDSAIDYAALDQAFTFYIGKKTKHMYPNVLSQKICSLNPGVDRLALTVKANYKDGLVEFDNYEIFVSVINSKEKLNYGQGDRINEGNIEELTKHTPEVIENVRNSFVADKKVRAQRTKHGSAKYRVKEITWKLNEDGTEVVRAEADNDTPAHYMIETPMLTYNQIIADFAIKNNIPILYRVEEGINEEKWLTIVEYVQRLGLSINENVDIRNIKEVQTELNRVISQAERYDMPKGSQEINKDFAHVVSVGIVSKLEKAKASIDNIGHTSLNFEAYAHNTSPIRRFVDTVNQRQILAYLCGEPLPYTKKDLAELQEHINSKELESKEAEREVNKLYETFHIRKMLRDGETICGTGYISHVEDDHIIVTYKYGTVQIDIPMESMLDSNGRVRTHNIYSVGQKMDVQVVKADLGTRTVYGVEAPIIGDPNRRESEHDMTE